MPQLRATGYLTRVMRHEKDSRPRTGGKILAALHAESQPSLGV